MINKKIVYLWLMVSWLFYANGLTEAFGVVALVAGWAIAGLVMLMLG